MTKWKVFLQRVLAFMRFFINPAACIAIGSICYELFVDIATTTGFLVLLQFIGFLFLLVLVLLMLSNGIQYYFDSFVLTQYIKSSPEAKESVIKFCRDNKIGTRYYSNIDITESEVK